jgi:hypothetical protein
MAFAAGKLSDIPEALGISGVAKNGKGSYGWYFCEAIKDDDTYENEFITEKGRRFFISSIMTHEVGHQMHVNNKLPEIYCGNDCCMGKANILFTLDDRTEYVGFCNKHLLELSLP